jgi:methyl-accepting chemotaxis protein
VAGEVKELAQQTAAATEDITQRITAIQNGSSQATIVIHKIGGIVAEISETQTVIAAAVEQQSATTQEMSRNIGDTATGANQIAANISGVAQSAKDTSEGAVTTRLTADRLAESSDNLRQLIAAFRY